MPAGGRPAPPAPIARRAWLIWGTAVAAYVVAVFQRGSLGVAGITAQHRFHASPAVLALFPVVQLAVYAALQIPVGSLVDRYGSRRLLMTGGIVMAGGQLVLAGAHSVPGALLARLAVGTGDAMTFISVLRLVGVWFPATSVPVVTQLTGILGQLGQVLAAYPLVALLRGYGWSTTFGVAAATGFVVVGAVLLAVRDVPPGPSPAAAPREPAPLRAGLRDAWREPGTRLGLWTHFVTQFPATVFALLWGYPFLVAGERRSPGTASGLLSLLVVVGMGVAPLLGRLVARWPYRRSVLTLAISGASAAVWTAVLVWPHRTPLLLLVLLVVVLASNGPGSMVGFDYARTENPVHRLGAASGIVNVGGFVASLLTILGIGFILNLVRRGGGMPYTRDQFRVAFCLPYVTWTVGWVQVWRTRAVLRARLASHGRVLDPFPAAVARRVRARRR